MKQLALVFFILLGVLLFFYKCSTSQYISGTKSQQTEKITKSNISPQTLPTEEKTLLPKDENIKKTQDLPNETAVAAQKNKAEEAPIQDTIQAITPEEQLTHEKVIEAKKEEVVEDTIQAITPEEQISQEKGIEAKQEEKITVNNPSQEPVTKVENEQTSVIENRPLKSNKQEKVKTQEKSREEMRQLAYEKREALRLQQEEKRLQRATLIEKEIEKHAAATKADEAIKVRDARVQLARDAAEKAEKETNAQHDKALQAREQARQEAYDKVIERREARKNITLERLKEIPKR